MTTNRLLLVGLACAGLVTGCGGGGGGGEPDAGPPPFCPADAPDPDQQIQSGCCARQDNSTAMGDFALRIAAMNLTAPGVFTSPFGQVIEQVLNHSLDIEGFNWVVQVTGADAGDGPVSITTGVGIRESTAGMSSYHFYNDATDMIAGGSTAWEPVTTGGDIAGTSITTGGGSESFSVPVFNEQALAMGNLVVDLVLPLQDLTLVNMTMDATFTCVGERSCTTTPNGQVCTGYDTTDGSVITYITVDDAEMAAVTATPLNNTLCDLLARPATSETTGCPGGTDSCCGDTANRTGWTYKPDSICDVGGCMLGSCDPDTTCNAWQLVGTFAAQGIPLSP